MSSDIIETVEIKIEADSKEAKKELDAIKEQAGKIGDAFSTAIGDALKGTKSFEDILRGLAGNISQSLFQAGIAPLQQMVSGSVSHLASSLLSAFMPFAQGGVVSAGTVKPFAAGGIVSSPTLFPMANGAGLMGEAGPEAIMPLRRGADGSLGIAANQDARPVQVVMNISTPDAQSFAKSENQIAIKLARAVGRGRRGL